MVSFDTAPPLHRSRRGKRADTLSANLKLNLPANRGTGDEEREKRGGARPVRGMPKLTTEWHRTTQSDFK